MLVVDGIEFDDAPSEIEGSPYWVDLWTEVNGYKMGLQVKPTTYSSANTAFYSRGAKASEEKGHKKFMQDYGGKVFIITPHEGLISEKQVTAIRHEYERLSQMMPRER